MTRVQILLVALVALAANTHAQFDRFDVYKGISSFRGVEAHEAERTTEDRISTGIYLRDPWVGRQRGLIGEGMGLGLYGSQGIDAWLIYTDERRAEFSTISIRDGDLYSRLEWRWIDGWLRAQSTLSRTRSMEQIDPLQYVRRVERAVAALIESDRPSAETRALELDAIFVELPDYWQDARRSLVNPRRAFAESALNGLEHLTEWLETSPEAFADMTWDPTFELFFDQHLRKALAATAEFTEWLEDTVVKMNNFQGAIDRLRWESLVHATTGLAVDAEDVHKRVLGDLADLLMKLPDEPLEVETDRALLGNALAEGSNLAWEHGRSIGLFQEETALSIQPRWTKVRGGLAPPSYLANPRDGSIEVHQAIEAAGGPIHYGIGDWRRSVPGQTILGMHYGAAGEAWITSRYLYGRAEGERLWNDATKEGLALYATDWPFRVGDTSKLTSEAELPRAAIECRVEAAILLLCSIELHALQVTMTRASESLSRRAGLSRDAAAYIAEQVLRDPLSGLGYLAYETLIRWEGELSLTGSTENAVRAIYSALSDHPTALIADLRQVYTAVDIGR